MRARGGVHQGRPSHLLGAPRAPPRARSGRRRGPPAAHSPGHPFRPNAQVPRNFVEPDPVVHSPDFPFDWETNRAFAESAYRADARLHRLLPRLVPKRVSEEGFWRNYFSHVFAIKCRFAGRELGEPLNQLAPPPGQVESAAARLARAGSLTSQLPYPERFQLALKYVTEGPSLPVDAAPGDRILMDVLSQQATVGQCNAPRPGMWESAEAKARHEAWARLGGMSSHEAMHLYVQALQIFRKDWVLWEGLQITPDMIRRADAVTTPKRELLTSADRARSSPAVCAGAAQAAAATPGGRDGACNSLPVCASPQPAAAPSAPPPANGTAPPPPPPVANGAPTSPPAATRPAPAPAEHTLAPAPAERVFLLGISPSSRAVAVLLEQLPAARHVQVVSVPRLSELPESVQRGCAKLPLLVDAGRALELWCARTCSTPASACAPRSHRALPSALSCLCAGTVTRSWPTCSLATRRPAAGASTSPQTPRAAQRCAQANT